MNLERKIEREALISAVATRTVETFLNVGGAEKAKEFARQTIENWRADGATRAGAIKDFTNWLCTKGIVLDMEDTE